MAMKMAVLASGSSGNSIYLSTDNTAILIDAGLSGKELERRMKSVKLNPEDISAILVTHEHGDHIKGAGVLSRRYNIPIYASAGTWKAARKKLGKIGKGYERTIEESWQLGDFEITSFPIPHDAAEPVGFVVSDGDVNFGLATDIGYIADELYDHLKDLDCILLEANHDIDLLREGSYPGMLKRRIRGNEGHLSNDETAELLPELLKTNEKSSCPVVLLSHLSAENNRPELAYLTVKNSVCSAGFQIGKDLILKCAPRDEASEIYNIETAEIIKGVTDSA
ncbi:MBL fold metallo-hydrolase [Halanaerobiaceae bacterium Z-7014]|uniref:MBL fold metallo-hydrolase n=2 Tax=Halonatronomonas betaini TaxID=2778430 RepID=A0A931AY08_9FIRM|nr:MBL fold metallo-hydrolase [Halonatronomonas betaini]